MSMISACRKVCDTLNNMNITYDIVDHPAVYTIEEMDKLHIGNKNEVVKNLFIRDDKKKRYFIIVLEKNKKADLKELRVKLNCRPLSFASEESLHKYLGLSKGAVTPFGVLNDTDCKVEVVFDKEVLTFKKIGIHPNDNTATVWISPEDLISVIGKQGNSVLLIEI
ncbi:prolyl-tRNA synthetase associated domain-containing protein [Paenibacillus sp. N3/727]|uniref:prolyl-tRNA synthetase associated domain-containing protein n=1 Tax=Paenibacillus sp. N3/727 TaxID=2925845 RepID=UPI001F5373AD|nr:prolyl-tRNA synthetase associated domain-containing protein [Paenibacillus sp. N3/727]UNK20694.1 prolyl-tRNA synthetase associated domain-containing protein [Paenibacillus sp. N3/727]